VVALRSDHDIVRARSLVRAFTIDLGFGLVDITKVVTAASELARNTVVHGGGGTMTIELVENGGRRGVRMSFADEGPGIPDVARALQDGYSTNGGMGLGLGGSRRLVHEFDIQSEAGKGTRVTLVRWK
jgi:serine/threonine-protein kinase RsbT